MPIEEKKIAVFAQEIDFARMNFKPKSKFKLIHNFGDVCGIDFEAIITFRNWHYDTEKVEAYEFLISRHPKLRP